jgi:predicted DNA-binding transcriptional regulator AlpA
MSNAIYTDKIVAGLVGVTRRTLKLWASQGYGPARRKIGPRRVGYLASEVDAFLATRPAVGARAGAA